MSFFETCPYWKCTSQKRSAILVPCIKLGVFCEVFHSWRKFTSSVKLSMRFCREPYFTSMVTPSIVGSELGTIPYDYYYLVCVCVNKIRLYRFVFKTKKKKKRLEVHYTHTHTILFLLK